MAIITSQDGIKKHEGEITNYSLFMGGLNTKHNALEQYTPLKTGYARVFITRLPKFMEVRAGYLTSRFKHMIEYGFIGVDGLQNTTLEFEQLSGGYTGRSFDTAVNAKDDTNEITIKVYEFSGSPLREYINLWLTGIVDPNTGLGHYHGALDGKDKLTYSQHNHTMEMIYVNTDITGRADSIEYACLFTNMMPKEVKIDQFNYDAGQHSLAQVDLSFTVVKYESAQINSVAKALMKRYNILRNYLGFHSDYEVGEPSGSDSGITHNGIDIAPESKINDWREIDINKN